MGYHFTLTRIVLNKNTYLTKTSVGKDMETPEPSYTADGNAEWYDQRGEQFGGSSRS